jgi:hypothetical protein
VLGPCGGVEKGIGASGMRSSESSLLRCTTPAET